MLDEMRELKKNLMEFKEYISDKQILCFGAGLRGHAFVDILENWNMYMKLAAFIDNDSQKQGKTIVINNQLYSIISLDEVSEYLSSNIATVTVIACSDVIGVKKQLDNCPELNWRPCFSLAEVASQQLLASDYDSVRRDENDILIPKKIHYAWFGGNKTDSVKKNIEKWHKMCPDYEIIEWNEDNYDIEKNTYMKEAYQRKQWGFVSDYLRLDVIYQYGGIYLDTDVEIVKSPDELLYQHGFLISDCSFFVNLGSGFGAAPQEPLIKEMLDYYNNVHFIRRDGSLNRMSCIGHQYRVLKNHGFQVNDSIQTIQGIHIYPMIMSSTNYYTLQRRESDKAFFAHYGNGSWLTVEYVENRQELQKEDRDGRLINYHLNK